MLGTPTHTTLLHNYTIRSHVVTIIEGMKDMKRVKEKIEVGSGVKPKVREMEDNTMKGRGRQMKKEVVGCFQAVVGRISY